MKAIRRFFLSLGLLSLLLSGAASTKKPKLVLIVVVDQFRYDYLMRFRADYKGGIARLLDHGAVFLDAHYPQYPTVTAVGHSTVATGATPSVSGIINNNWFDHASSEKVTSVSDKGVDLVEHGGSGACSDSRANGSSPRRLLVSTVSDELKIVSGASKVTGISIKDRGAILTAGHMADAAYWLDPSKKGFVTSTYYRTCLPDWLARDNERWQKKVKEFREWRPLDQPGAEPFCSMNGMAAKSCGALEYTPLGNELLEDLAEEIVEHEYRGSPGTNVLTVSFSSNDYVGHKYGPDSDQVHDMAIRTDRILGALLKFIDEKIGFGETLVVFTADHGVAPAPKVNLSRKMPGGFITGAGKEIQAQLVKKYCSEAKCGEAKWFLDDSDDAEGFLYLNYKAVAATGIKEAEGLDGALPPCPAEAAPIRRFAAEQARKLKHIARVFTCDDLLKAGGAVDAVGRAVQLGFYGPRSADLILLPEPYFLFGPEQDGTTHFTPYSYDTHVPLIFYGPGIPAGPHYERVAVNDVAPTLAALLDLEAPSGSSGNVLAEIVGTAGTKRKVVAGRPDRHGQARATSPKKPS